tara:strand:- start:96 stop:935 length:840 start_codon:yes stop_codon:yes gene_type:complete
MRKVGKRQEAQSDEPRGAQACLDAISRLPGARPQAKAAEHLFARRRGKPVRQKDAAAIANWISLAPWQPQLKAHVLACLLANVDPGDALTVLVAALRALHTRAAWGMVALLLIHTTAGSTNLLGLILEGPRPLRWNEELYIAWAVMFRTLFKDAKEHPAHAFGPEGSLPWNLLLRRTTDPAAALVATVAAAQPSQRTVGLLCQVIAAVPVDTQPDYPAVDPCALFMRARDAVDCLGRSFAPGWAAVTTRLKADRTPFHTALGALVGEETAKLLQSLDSL